MAGTGGSASMVVLGWREVLGVLLPKSIMIQYVYGDYHNTLLESLLSNRYET